MLSRAWHSYCEIEMKGIRVDKLVYALLLHNFVNEVGENKPNLGFPEVDNSRSFYSSTKIINKNQKIARLA